MFFYHPFVTHTHVRLRPVHPQSHRQLVDGVVSLARRIQADKELSALIRRKFAIKCTTGKCLFCINSLLEMGGE